MTYTYRNSGVCSRSVSFDIDDDGCVRNIKFEGGCHGNTQGVSRLADGMKAEELVARLKGIRCGMRPSSCPDQLAKAVEQAMNS